MRGSDIDSERTERARERKRETALWRGAQVRGSEIDSERTERARERKRERLLSGAAHSTARTRALYDAIDSPPSAHVYRI